MRVETRVMVPKFFPLLQRCVEEGVERGWNRAHKHTSTPDDRLVQDTVVSDIMNELFEWFDFPTQDEA